MLAILSPAKDMKVLPAKRNNLLSSEPEFLHRAETLMKELKKLDSRALEKTMKMSKALADLNHLRFQNWNSAHHAGNSGQAVLSFTGEAYRGLSAGSWSADDLIHSQNVLRILSGLYGVLRPLDLIQEYRLEMGSKQHVNGKKNLYEFWKTRITQIIEQAVAASPGDAVLVNLASKEYAQAIDLKNFSYRVITPNFYNESQGELKMVTVFAKKARGLMARFLVENRLEKLEDLRAFDAEGYYFDNQRSTEHQWVFVR